MRSDYIRAKSPTERTSTGARRVCPHSKGQDGDWIGFPNLVRDERDARGINREQLAVAANVHSSMLRRLEAGTVPTFTRFLRVCAALGKSPVEVAPFLAMNPSEWDMDVQEAVRNG